MSLPAAFGSLPRSGRDPETPYPGLAYGTEPVAGPSWKRSLGVLATTILILAVAAGCWAGWLRMTGNIHEIEPGIYRSGQLDAARLSTFVREHGIRTVINLRGENPSNAWYVEEVAATTQAGVRYVSLPLSANRQPDPALLKALVAILRTARAPLLIHCNGGADRSALASALYELVVMHRPPSEAERQLSVRFGHFPWLGSRTGAMDRTFAAYVAHGAPE